MLMPGLASRHAKKTRSPRHYLTVAPSLQAEFSLIGIGLKKYFFSPTSEQHFTSPDKTTRFSSSSKVWSTKEKIITGIQQLYHASQWLRPLRATCAESGQCLHYTVLLFLCDLSVTCLGESKSIWNGLFCLSLCLSNTHTDVNTQNLFFWVRGRLWIHSHMSCDWKNKK